MSYAKQNFRPGDVLLASQLNAMDDQIALNEAASRDFITSAGEYAAAAAASAAAAKTSEEAAEAAADAASGSADAASDSEVAANNSATAAALSAQGSYASAAAADASETAAAASQEAAAASATAAAKSAQDAKDIRDSIPDYTDMIQEMSDLKSVLSDSSANIVARYFELIDPSVDSTNADIYTNRLGAIHYIALYGFTSYQKYRLNLIARNHSGYHYRFIIYGYNGSTWVSAFDTGSDFTVTENTDGDTLVSATIGTQKVVMLVNYSKLVRNGFSWNINNNRYNFTENVFAYDMNDYASIESIRIVSENCLERYFILENDTYNAEYSDLYLQRLGAIHYIKLVGFEQYTKCRLRLIARNHSSFHYRFIVAGYNGTSWTDVFDTGSNFTVTENANGDTYVTAAVGTKSVEMYIDYSKFPNNFSWNESSSTGSYRYIFSQNVYGKADENDVIPDIYFTKNSNENFDIVYHYSDTENVMIKFSPIGVNNLFAPHYLYKRTATKNEPVFSGYTAWETIGTDWVSPYQGIIENDPSVSSGITVGGNHGTNGSSGFPTAQRVSIVAYADGKETELNKIYGCSEVKIIVTTNIAASNTINMETGAFTPAMRETIVWTVTKNNFEVCVYLEALKNISIKGYTGLQMTPGANPAIYFNDGTGQKSITGTRIDSVSYPTFKGNRSVILNTADGDLRITYTNRQVGIGNLSHISSGNPVAYVSTNQKLYQHLVNTIPLDLQMGESACYCGGYTFMKSYECTGAKEAYFISYNGEKQYCVDFLTSGSCYAKLPAELIGHQIEVVEKDDVITIGQIVSGNGIYVASTGIGSVCFVVK